MHIEWYEVRRCFAAPHSCVMDIRVRPAHLDISRCYIGQCMIRPDQPVRTIQRKSNDAEDHLAAPF